MANTLGKCVRAGDLDEHSALTRYEEAFGLVDAFESDDQLTTEALATAVRYGHPVHDLIFVILARRHGCKVLTVDERLKALLRQMGEDVLG
jgi:predicted nucleic acid-binding protein